MMEPAYYTASDMFAAQLILMVRKAAGVTCPYNGAEREAAEFLKAPYPAEFYRYTPAEQACWRQRWRYLLSLMWRDWHNNPEAAQAFQQAVAQRKEQT